MLMLAAALYNSNLYHYAYILAMILLWASLIMTVYSGIEYVVKNKHVFRA